MTSSETATFLKRKKERVVKPEAQARLRELIKRTKNPELNLVVIGILSELKDLKPYIFHVSNNASVYIKFQSPKIPHSIRIGDHNKRGRYAYRYNIHLEDCPLIYWKENKFTSKTIMPEYHYHWTNTGALFQQIKEVTGTLDDQLNLPI